jgi:hypothetical protein
LLNVVNDMTVARPVNPAHYIFDAVFEQTNPPDDVAVLVASFVEGSAAAATGPQATTARKPAPWRSAGGATVDAFSILVPELRRIALLKSSGYPPARTMEH